MIGNITINATIQGLGSYIVLCLDSGGVFRLLNTPPYPFAAVPVSVTVHGAGYDLTLFLSALGIYTLTLDVASDNSFGAQFFGSILHSGPDHIDINYTTGIVTAGDFSDTLANILARSNGGGGGGQWILDDGTWDDSGTWIDAAVWKDAA